MLSQILSARAIQNLHFTKLPFSFALLFIGEAPGGLQAEQADVMLANMAKTEISLTLNNKFDVLADSDEDQKKTFLK